MTNRKKLIQTANELNDLINPEPKLSTGEDTTDEEIIRQIIEAAGLLTADDELPEVTQSVLQKVAPDIMKILTNETVEENSTEVTAVVENNEVSVTEVEKPAITEVPESTKTEVPESTKLDKNKIPPRARCIGKVLIKVPKGTVKDLIKKSDDLYTKNGGKSNLRVSETYTNIVINAFMGYGILKRDGKNYEI